MFLKTVCVDIDGVILDLMQGLKLDLKPLGYDLDIDGIKAYNFKYDTLGFDRQIVFHAFENIKCFELAPFYSGAVTALEKLQCYAKTKAYTKSSDKPDIYMERKKLIHKLKLSGEPITDVKKPTDLSADALFDDCLEVHKQWIEDGSTAKLYLIDRPYNQRTPENENIINWTRITRCKSFEEAVELYTSRKGYR